MNEKKTCFFISPIGEEGSEERKRSDDVLEYIITPVADTKFGYNVIRADKIGKPGMITSQVIEHVLESDLVVADLAYRNPNVFYELALRHAIRKPFIQIIEEGKAIPFDVAGVRTIYLNHTDLGSAERARRKLVEQIEAIHADPENIESPVTQAIDLQRLRQSGGQLEEYVVQMMEMLSDLKGQVAQLTNPQPTLSDNVTSVLSGSFGIHPITSQILTGIKTPTATMKNMVPWTTKTEPANKPKRHVVPRLSLIHI